MGGQIPPRPSVRAVRITGKALPFHRPFAVLALRPCPSSLPFVLALPLPFRRPFAVLSVSLYFLPLPFRRPFAVLSVSLYFLPLPFRRPFAVLLLPFSALSLPFTAVLLPVERAVSSRRAAGWRRRRRRRRRGQRPAPVPLVRGGPGGEDDRALHGCFAANDEQQHRGRGRVHISCGG